MSSTTYLSRGIDYLGDLGAKLRDLQGYRTLAYELIQNADDAKATSICFELNHDAIVVDNDGIFSDCHEVEAPDCPWKVDRARRYRCDFHRFRYVASGDKREEPGTTGAFGIGFIAVYQITDSPELISAGRHWIVHEADREDHRIAICGGCSKCARRDLPRTRFILPWARDSKSSLRQVLDVETVPDDAEVRMLRELEQCLHIAMLFLKNVQKIEVKAAGQLVRAIQRVDDENSLILSDGKPDNDQIWHIVRGEFSQEADELRRRHPGRIEQKRSAKVTLAIPYGLAGTGLLCACLPTEHDVGLPFHINADFFPTSDRKRVIFAADYQSEWNQEALQAAARALAEAIGKLPGLLGADRFWSLISALKEVSEKAQQGEHELTVARFWREVGPKLSGSSVIYTTRGTWIKPADATLLGQQEEADAVPMLEGLGIKIVHQILRPYYNVLRGQPLSIPLLNIERLCTALASAGLTRRSISSELPLSLRSVHGREALWAEIALLLDGQRGNQRAKSEDEQRLRGVAIAPGRDGALWPCGTIYTADDDTIALFEAFGCAVSFLSDNYKFAPLRMLCPSFEIPDAVDALADVDHQKLERSWNEKKLPLAALFSWFDNRRQQILADEETRRNLIALPLYPSSGRLCPSVELALPGNFNDPLGLAQLVDLPAIGDRRELLHALGMHELNFRTYALAHVPNAVCDSTLNAERRRAVVLLLARRTGELKDDIDVQRALASAPLIECTDGEFRQARTCYFDSETVRDCLGGAAHVATLPAGHAAAIHDLFEWLGVAHELRLADIVKRVRVLTEQPYSADAVTVIHKILAYLGKRVKPGDDPVELRPLRTTQWLPARDRLDRWYAPTELYATYQQYLFASQAIFLGAPTSLQTPAVLEFLGVRSTPEPSLVVKHLLHCADRQVPVNTEVYRFLNDRADDGAIEELQGTKCLFLSDAYRAPNEVFWLDHPFGRYRWRLAEGLRSYARLLMRLGVRETPDHDDALGVLREISSEFGRTNAEMDEHAHVVLMACWRMLDEALDKNRGLTRSVEDLRTVKCIPRRDGILQPPEWMFFENRAGLAAKFDEFLTNNVITRPLGAASAFSTAGVRSLGTAVEIELLECVNPVDNPDLMDRLRTRRNEVARVLESQVPGRPVAEALSRLDRMHCRIATSLIIRYRLNAFRQDLQSTLEHVPAFYDSGRALLLVQRDGRMPWGAIAREVAIALFPEEDPGSFAAGIKEVLASETVEEAGAMLDELGFARLDTETREALPTAEPATKLGTQDVLSEGLVQTQPGKESGAPELQVPTPEKGIEPLVDPNAPSPSPPAVAPEPGPVVSVKSGNKQSSAKKRGRPVLRTYLPSPGPPNGEQDEDDYPVRSPVDEAGICRVMEYEAACGRIPTEMPHKNPGYDIKSRDASGNIARYIEVKSLSGKWRDTYAVLSRPQFNKANGLGDAFWLYVVEHAESDDFCLHRIQNPALRANHFMFDDGWRAFSERPSSASGTE